MAVWYDASMVIDVWTLYVWPQECNKNWVGELGPTMSKCSLQVLWLWLLSFLLAEEVLLYFRDQFISEVDTDTVVMELLHRSIIDEGDRREISGVHNPKVKNGILHEHLKKKCTIDALRTVCDVMIGVAGNPKMAALGNDMKKRLESGNGACACANMWVC